MPSLEGIRQGAAGHRRGGPCEEIHSRGGAPVWSPGAAGGRCGRRGEAATMARMRVGTCSWKFPSWAGLVYSASEGIDYLQEYAKRYETVEIDQWFWSLHRPGHVSLPRERDVLAYRRAVPDAFRFTVKAPNSITLTHFYRRSKRDPLVANPSFLDAGLMERFLERLTPLDRTLGPLLLQFEYLNRQKISGGDELRDRLAAFARDLPRTHGFAVEVRNPPYLKPDFFDFLADAGLRPVLQQGYWMPPIAEIYDRCREAIGRHPTVVLRLHGPDRQGIERKSGKRWDRIVEPREGELRAAVAITEDLVARGIDVFVNINNHFEGSAPLSIERFRAMAGS
ncbi:MAG: DUF72 domain-containing protein [Candidatus Eisenbacteria bacterium]|nr:DUF72 domain-containing protein [Candidatus Eisenbacteria bacterium]